MEVLRRADASNDDPVVSAVTGIRRWVAGLLKISKPGEAPALFRCEPLLGFTESARKKGLDVSKNDQRETEGESSPSELEILLRPAVNIDVGKVLWNGR